MFDVMVTAKSGIKTTKQTTYKVDIPSGHAPEKSVAIHV